LRAGAGARARLARRQAGRGRLRPVRRGVGSWPGPRLPPGPGGPQSGSRERGLPPIRDRLGHCARRPAVQGAGCSAQHRVERGISRQVPVGVEGVPREPAERADHRPWHEHTSHMLPLGRGLAEQKAYIRRTLDLIASTTGVRPTGWSSPSVYSNGDTTQAVAAEGITYTLDQMDSDIISRLATPNGSLVLLPYPVVTVDMGQQLARMKSPTEIETLWVDYVAELANEARADPAREATTVIIGIHPFVVGTPDGAAAMRRVLSRFKKDDAVWLADSAAILKAAGLK